MKKLKLILGAFCLLLTIISSAQTTLSFRLTNPKVDFYTGFGNYLSFDIEVKAAAAGSFLWSGQAILNFNNSVLSTTGSDWSVAPKGTLLSGTYLTGGPTPTTVTKYPLLLGNFASGVYNIAWGANSASNTLATNSTYFNEVATSWQPIAAVTVKITGTTSDVAGTVFVTTSMDNQEFYHAGPSSNLNYLVAYADQFTDLYVERIFSNSIWSQLNVSPTGVDWAVPVSTSVWDGNATIPSGGSVSTASTMRIHPTATVTLPVGAKLTVTGATEVNNINGLSILSDATGTGSLITASATGVGSSLAQRYMTSGAWHIISAPLIQTIGSFLTSNSNIATNSISSARGIIDYDPLTNVWNAPTFNNSSPQSLGAGKGFSMRVTATGIVTFAGAIQAGAQPVTTLGGYWNCVGNPYTSAIGMNIGSSSGAINNFLTVNSANLDPINGAIYVWEQPDASNGQYGKYTTYSNATGGLDFQQGQAFMVKLAAGATTVDYTTAMQIHNTGLLLKSTASVWPTIKLKATLENQSNSTIITFNSAMTRGLDPTYDAGLLKGTTDLVVYSRLVEDNGIPFAIQALPDNGYGTMIIPVGIDSKAGGDVVFSSESMNLPVNCKVVLEDKLLKTFTDLSKGVYNVTIAANSSISDRFQIHTSDLTSGLNDASSGLLNAYAVKNIEIRIVGAVSNEAVATLYDVVGKVILIANLKEGNLNVIPTPNIKPAIYMLSVKDNNKLQSFKLLLRE